MITDIERQKMNPSAASSAPRQLILPFLSSVEHFEGPFLRGASNHAACQWLYDAQGSLHWPDGRLVLWGDEGVGKSHLLHLWAAHSKAIILPASAFVPEAHEQLLALIGQRKGVCLGIDDIDTLPEESLFLHVLNFISEQEGKILIVGRASPQNWSFSLLDLQSRIRAAHNVAIQPPDDGLLYQLIVTEAQHYQLSISTDLVNWLLQRLPRTARAIKQAVRRLDGLSMSLGTGITKEVATQMLESMNE